MPQAGVAKVKGTADYAVSHTAGGRTWPSCAREDVARNRRRSFLGVEQLHDIVPVAIGAIGINAETSHTVDHQVVMRTAVLGRVCPVRELALIDRLRT